MNIHYIPRFILGEFKGSPSLIERNKTTGICGPRDVALAAQREDFWPERIELGLMQIMDDHASKIFQRRVFGQSQIHLSPIERRRLANWFGLWVMRVPKHLERMKYQSAEARANPEFAVECLYERGYQCVELFRAKHRQLYDKHVEVMGHARARGYLLASWAKMIREGRLDVVPLPHDAFVQHVESDSFEKPYGEHFDKMTWTWFRSDDVPFVIGDDPVCRFGTARQRWEYGISHSDVEVTIPLTKSLCLLMTNYGTETGQVVMTDRVLEFNRRQIASALELVYGPSEAALWPDDDLVEYGFMPSAVRIVSRRRRD